MIIQCPSTLSKKSKQQVRFLLATLADDYRDYYMTKNNLRLFIKENVDIMFKDLIKGDKIAFGEKSIINVVGFADKSQRKYIKVLAEDLNEIPKLMFAIASTTNEDLYCKLKKDNPIKDLMMQLGFEFFGDRGQEVLLKREKRNND